VAACGDVLNLTLTLQDELMMQKLLGNSPSHP
jgi:hypothetical protein